MSNHKFTADLHLGHKFMSELRGLDSLEDHDEYVMDGLRRSVSKTDILWILGDYSVSKHEHARGLLATLPCRKILIPGNHDPEHGMHRRAWNAQRKALEVFDAVLPYQRIRLSKINFLMSHLPFYGEGDHTPGNRFNEYRLVNEGIPLLCGHVHEAWRTKGNQLNVGVDVNGFEAVSADAVVEWWHESGCEY